MTAIPPTFRPCSRAAPRTWKLPGVVVPWGAAGKGIVLAHALVQAGADVPYAIDADPGRQGLHMEVSGVPILDPDRGVEGLPRDAHLWVCNPNHTADVGAFLAAARAQ